MSKVAVLSNEKDVVVFTFNDVMVRFKGPYSLEYFSKVILYDKGYIEVMCKFTHDKELIEDYIDMENIVSELYMDPSFLEEIDTVRCEHE